MVARGWGMWGEMGVMAKGPGVSFGSDENVLKLMVIQLCKYTKNH